ncbi:MAG: hypothetical protein KIT76_10670 [Pseudolabrys sp.]|nr:hypothetical protein [Gemmatimonadales bacterium]MCW5688995.1 hypothetical protein [Pseudolabrys sp.]
MSRSWLIVALGAGMGCAAAAPGGAPTTIRCPAADTTSGHRIASVFIDGREVAAGLSARRGAEEFPETYSLDGPEPEALAALPVERIDLIEYARGADAERRYRLCPGGVALLITTTGR